LKGGIKMKNRNKRLMTFTYKCKEDLIDRLKSRLDICNIQYVIFKDYEFTDGDFCYKIFIDKNKCTWGQVMEEVNRVRAVKFRYNNEHYIENGQLYTDVILYGIQ
jgi:hypothetical protein